MPLVWLVSRAEKCRERKREGQREMVVMLLQRNEMRDPWGE
jgi:hypothetical protein